MDYRLHHGQRRLKHWLSAPFIYSVIIPAVFLDLMIEIYHRICFPLYGMPYVQRSHYIRVDRHKLQYLFWYEKMNCLYCGYVNGLLRYASMIAQVSERYWCGIMHQKGGEFIPPPYQEGYLPYGDKAAFDAFVAKKEHEDEFPQQQQQQQQQHTDPS